MTPAQWILLAILVVVVASLLDWLDGWMVRRARREHDEDIDERVEKTRRDGE